MNKNFRYVKKKGKKFIQNKVINKNPHFFEVFTTKNVKNKARVKKIFGLKTIHTLKQIHSSKNVFAGKKLRRGIKADGLITNTPGAAVASKVADCIANIIVDPKKKVVAAVHSGWRGVVKKIVLDTVSKMKKKYKCKPADLIVSMSPAIGVCCFEIGQDLYRKLKKQKVFSNTFKKKNGKIFMDIKKANKNLFLKEGVKSRNIYINDLCTSTRKDLFHSYRRQGKKAGRMLGIIMIK